MEMHKISIIIPVYNVEQYLSQCLDSVINQTYQNLEIILVNDGSTDSCPQICEDYNLADSRIKVIHKENGGLSDARNIGLSASSGDFISFLDSDDLLSLEFYDILLKTLLENDADIAECNFFEFKMNQDLNHIKNSNKQFPEVFETEIALRLLMEGSLNAVVWNKIYRREVLSDILFPVNRINEDEYWTYRVFGRAKKIVKVQNFLHFYRQQPNSIMGGSYSIKRLDCLQGLHERIFYMQKYFPNLQNLATQVFCLVSMYHYYQLSIHSKLDPQKIHRRKVLYNAKQFNKFFILKNWYWKYIILYQIFIIVPENYIRIRNYMELRVHNSK